MIKIEWVNWGLASRVGDTIYLSKDLNEDKILLDAILEHELAHTKDFGFKDVINDLQGLHLNKVKGRYWKFIFKHPKTLVQFLPIWFYDRQPSIDITLSIVWIFSFIIAWKIIQKII